MRWYAKVLGHEQIHEVDLTRDGQCLVAKQGDRTVRVDCVAIDGGEKYSILLDGRSFDVTVDGDGRRLSLVVDGHAWHAEVEDERERAMSAIVGHAPAAGGTVESVMPGIVRKVHVSPGDAVKPGDRLLILEAMKMENEIRAESGGIIERVLITEGQTVDGGQPLVVIRIPAG